MPFRGVLLTRPPQTYTTRDQQLQNTIPRHHIATPQTQTTKPNSATKSQAHPQTWITTLSPSKATLFDNPHHILHYIGARVPPTSGLKQPLQYHTTTQHLTKTKPNNTTKTASQTRIATHSSRDQLQRPAAPKTNSFRDQQPLNTILLLIPTSPRDQKHRRPTAPETTPTAPHYSITNKNTAQRNTTTEHIEHNRKESQTGDHIIRTCCRLRPIGIDICFKLVWETPWSLPKPIFGCTILFGSALLLHNNFVRELCNISKRQNQSWDRPWG
jgi:hypothetical protein